MKGVSSEQENWSSVLTFKNSGGFTQKEAQINLREAKRLDFLTWFRRVMCVRLFLLFCLSVTIYFALIKCDWF